MQSERRISRRELRARRKADPGRKSLRGVLRRPEAPILAIAAFCLIAVGPLRGILPPAILFLATFALFFVPGMFLARLLAGRSFPGLARVPVAFALSVGIFGLSSVPALVLGLSFDAYLWICGVVLAVSLLLTALGSFRRRNRTESAADGEARFNWLWLPFTAFASILSYMSAVRFHEPRFDFWEYLESIRDVQRTGGEMFAPPTELGSFQGVITNWWLLEEAALSRVSGMDPVEMVAVYLAPGLVVVALLAFYALALALFENRSAALLASCLVALFFLVQLDSQLFAAGSEFVGRITEDKYVARFIFLPVALVPALSFLKERRARYLGLLFLLYLFATAVHPLGAIFIGIPLAGLGLLHLAAKPRSRKTWMEVGAVWAVPFVVVALPALFAMAVGELPTPKLEAVDPGKVETAVSAKQDEERLLQLGEGSFVMHPAFLLEPATLAAYLLGVPFLLWRFKRKLAARLLLGTMLVTPVLIYIPPVSTFIAWVIGPWILYRLAWPLNLAALLVVGWMAWAALKHLAERLDGRGVARSRAIPFLPLVLIGVLTALAAPWALAGIQSADASGGVARSESSCMDPAFPWIRDEMEDPGKVLAPRDEGRCVSAYSASADVISQGTASSQEEKKRLRDFFEASSPDGSMVEVVNGADHVLLPANSPLNARLERLPQVTALDNPGDRYHIYAVDR